jgi:hypothetical protein
MKTPPLVPNDSKILTPEILKTNQETIFDLRLKFALLRKISIELSKMMKGIDALIKNVLYEKKH